MSQFLVSEEVADAVKRVQFVASLVAVIALVVLAVSSVLVLREQRQQTCFAGVDAAAQISEFAVQTAEGEAAIAEAQRDRDTLLQDLARTRNGCR